MQFAYTDSVTVTAASEFKDFSGTDSTAIKSAIELVCCGTTDRLLVPLLEQGIFHFQFAAVILENTTTVNVVRFEIKFFSAKIFKCTHYAIRVPDGVLNEYPHCTFQSVEISAVDQRSLLCDVMDKHIRKTVDTLPHKFTLTGLDMHTPLQASASALVEHALRVMCSDAAPSSLLIPITDDRPDWATGVSYAYFTRKDVVEYFYGGINKTVTADLVTISATPSYLRQGHHELSRKQLIKFNYTEMCREFPGFNINMTHPQSSGYVRPPVFFKPVINHYTDTIRELEQQLGVDRHTAFAMAFHFGAPIAEIGADNLELIVKHLVH